jgi:hypothetical protein
LRSLGLVGGGDGGSEFGSVAGGCGGVFVGGDFPGGGVGEEAAYELGVQRMAGFAGFHAA